MDFCHVKYIFSLFCFKLGCEHGSFCVLNKHYNSSELAAPALYTWQVTVSHSLSSFIALFSFCLYSSSVCHFLYLPLSYYFCWIGSICIQQKTIQQILAYSGSTCKSVLTPLRPFLQQSLTHPAGQTGIKCEQYTELTWMAGTLEWLGVPKQLKSLCLYWVTLCCSLNVIHSVYLL